MSASAAFVPTRRSSLTQHLLLWSLGALVAVWGSFVFMGYQTGVHEADELTDGHLASVASLLLDLRAFESVDEVKTTQRTHLPGLKAHDYQQSLSVVQWNAEGRVVSANGSAPLPPFDDAEGLADLSLGSPPAAWRSFSQWNADRSRKIMVLVAVRERDDLAKDLAKQMIEPGLWLLPVVALALGGALRRGLKPLYDLSDAVASLAPAADQRLASQNAWKEFESVEASINTLLDRHQAALARERRLANEVAHELRTPLSSIVLQASALGGELAPEAQAQALDRIRQDALRAGHVLNQLLALARASRADLDGASARVDLAAMARAVCAEYAQAVWQRGHELEVSAPGTLCVRGHSVLLDLLLRNLIENALKHTPAHTRIAVQMGEASGDHGPWLQVCDDGARVVAADEAVPAAPVAVDSLHLGHEIVARVAKVHRARFGQTTAPAPFTTCYRLDFARESTPVAG